MQDCKIVVVQYWSVGEVVIIAREGCAILDKMAATPRAEVEFTAYEKMPEDTNCWQSRELSAVKKWVATEKIHGANFSFTVGCGGREVRVAKRGGYLKGGENFFGVWRQRELLEGEKEKARKAFAAVAEMRNGVNSVTVYGELFGGSLSEL